MAISRGQSGPMARSEKREQGRPTTEKRAVHSIQPIDRHHTSAVRRGMQQTNNKKETKKMEISVTNITIKEQHGNSVYNLFVEF